VFGKYTIVCPIGRGGHSSIYEASTDTGRVALKVLTARAPSLESAERLRREAVAIRRIEHPNVVRLFDYGITSDGNPWIAMELLHGETLASLLSRVGTITEPEIISIIAPICEALQETHRKGIVHRDLKPANIMLVPQAGAWLPKLLDFGIAALNDAEALTSSVTVSGTPMYMAPEQWDGLKHASARSDIYALAVIVYEALSGKYPFAADAPLVWMKKIHSQPPLDLAVAMGSRPVSPALCSAVMKALAKDPSARPETPMEFLRGLRPAPPSAGGHVASRPWVRAMIAALVAGVLAGTGGFYLSRIGNATSLPHNGPPKVVLMDTPVPRGVYDADAVARGGTNADTLNDLLRDLPISIEKETLPSTWNREMHVIELNPDVIVIHRSAFFHGLNLEFGFGYEPFPDDKTNERWTLLYRTADDKLITFMGLVATVNRRTKFLVYSRGTGSSAASESAFGWAASAYRQQWVLGLEQRFPALKGRVTTLAIAGGVEKGSFKNPEVVRQVRQALGGILGLVAQ